MSFNLSGFSTPLPSQIVSIQIDSRHPFMKLGSKIPWDHLLEIILTDLKKTEACQWWVGRPLNVRIHLGAYLLQQQFNLTDRHTERLLRDNAAYQVFCGRGLVDDFQVPDHTKIESFRSRLSPETQRQLANAIACKASKLGYANPREFDVDSTPQNANISYPSIPQGLKDIGVLAKRISRWLMRYVHKAKDAYQVNINLVNNLSLSYYRLKKKSDHPKAHACLQALWRTTAGMVLPVFKDSCILLQESVLKSLGVMKNRICYAIETLQWRAHWILDRLHMELFPEAEQNIYPTPPMIYSLHAQAVTCINKNKPNKKKYYGRAYQLGRIGGNFLIVQKCDALHMPDAQSLPGMLQEHAHYFGEETLESISADTAYYSADNITLLKCKKVKEIGLRRPSRRLKAPPDDLDELTRYRLYCRRSGIEALIGQTKHGGQLERSRMKSDQTTLSAGYASVLGFNLRQLNRYAVGSVCLLSVNRDDHSHLAQKGGLACVTT